jgi:hypothetical protein
MTDITEGFLFDEFSALAKRSSTAWEDYRIWNTAVCEYFFKGQFRGKPVYIDLDNAALSKIHASAFETGGDARAALRNAICRTVQPVIDPTNMFREHIGLAGAWRRSKFSGYPPFLALLALFSLVAESMIADEDFAPNNYYGRLTSFLGLPVPEEDVAKSYRAATEALWPALNTWLSNYEGALGYPTARALDHRIYVSVAISQALIRNQDRVLLRRMFDDLGLASGQKIAYEEMEALLIHWTGSHSPGSSLSRLCNKSVEIRRRIAELACAELEAWDGKSDRTAAQLGPALLVVVAQLRMEPVPALSLFFSSVAAIGATEDVVYRVARDADSRTKCAFPASDGRYVMQRLDGPDIWSLEPWASIQVSDALAVRVHLEPTSSAGRSLVRNGSQIVILEYREREALYREVPQIGLMQRSIVLVHDGALTRVRDFLARTSRPGFKEFRALELRGLPPMWNAFCDVHITQSAIVAGLEALSPAASRALIPSSGLLLSNNTWHSAAPPEVLAADTEAIRPLPVSIKQTMQIASAPGIDIAIGSFNGAGAFQLSRLELPDGDYEVQLGERKSVLDRISIRLRSSDNSRPWSLLSRPIQYAFSPLSPLGALTAGIEQAPQDSASVVSGADLVVETPIGVPLLDIQSSDCPDIGQEETGADSRLQTGVATMSQVESCVSRGYHIWSYEFVRPGTPRGHLVAATCSGCHLKIWHRLGGGARNNGNQSEPLRAEPRDLHVAPVQAKIPDKSHFETVFDALNYLRGGTFAQVSAIVAFADEEPWAPLEYARVLSSLAHVDLQLDPATFRPKQWRMSAPRVVLVGDKAAVFTGWRCPSLISMLEDKIRSVGGELRRDSSDRVPVVSILGLSKTQLESACSAVSIIAQEQIHVVADFSYRLASVLPRISCIADQLHVLRPNRERLERFNVRTAKWHAVDNCDCIGAYRSPWRGLTYFAVSSVDLPLKQGRQADSRLVKHLAAKYELTALLRYDERGILHVPLGCELPGLYERAVVMASGRPPVRAQGRVEYRNVSPELAQSVISRLRG